MIDIKKKSGINITRFVLSPNCSMSWFQVKCFFAITCLLAIAIALFFYLQGLWLIIPFSGLEMLALGLGLFMTCRHAHRREVITVNESMVTVEKGFDSPIEKWQFDRHWVSLRVDLENNSKARPHIALGSHGNYIEIGKFLSRFEKDELAFRLKRCIIPQ